MSDAGPRAEVSGLIVYPVKSMRGIEVGSAVLTARGLEHDRRFMVVRPDGTFVTQRDVPMLALVETAFEPGGVTLSRDGHGRIFIPFDSGGGRPVRTRVWKDECETIDQGEVVSRWLTEALESDEPFHLVAMAGGFIRRHAKADRLGPGTHTLFADAAPFLVATEASLAHLNRELVARGQAAVPMNRFRPNIVLKGPQAFAEHRIPELVGPGYALDMRYACERCIVTTIDQATAARNPGREPYRTLCEINPVPDREGKPAFGQNAILADGDGNTIRIGDPLRCMETT